MTELARSLTRLHATAMVAGTIIGASIFVQPSEIARHPDTPLSIMAAWSACGVLTLFGALVDDESRRKILGENAGRLLGLSANPA